MNVIDELNLNELMLNAGSPDEAILYFRKASGENPDRIDLKRGLGGSLSAGARTPKARRSGPKWS